MTEYNIVSVLWEDHSKFTDRELPSSVSLDEYIRPSLTIGLLYKKTAKYIIVVSHVNRYNEFDEADFMVIYKSAILAIQEYGKIKIDKLRNEGG